MIQKVAGFLGKKLTPEQTASLEDHLSFESMKANPAVNNETLLTYPFKPSRAKNIQFMRKGKVINTDNGAGMSSLLWKWVLVMILICENRRNYYL